MPGTVQYEKSAVGNRLLGSRKQSDIVLRFKPAAETKSTNWIVEVAVHRISVRTALPQRKMDGARPSYELFFAQPESHIPNVLSQCLSICCKSLKLTYL